MYPGSLPLISNGSVPAHEKLFNVRSCSMYTGVQFGRFHCSSIIIINISHIIIGNVVLITMLHPSSSSSSSSFLNFVFAISYHVYGQYCTFNSCTSRLDICQCLVVQTPVDNMSNKETKYFNDPCILQIENMFSCEVINSSMTGKLGGDRM